MGHPPARAPARSTGVDYHFVTREEFERLRDAGGFLEWFEVYGDLKGTPKQFVVDALAAGHDVLLELDVQGALAVREAIPDALLVFVQAPSRAEQRRRLEARGSDDPRHRSSGAWPRPRPRRRWPRTSSTPSW